MSFTRDDLEKLKCEVKKRLSEKRYLHTLGVAECAVRLAELCLPECREYAEAAGLLHDITKELSIEEERKLLKLSGECVFEDESEGVLHSLTAPYVIKRDFPCFSDGKILSAVYNHTMGAPDMSVLDEIIFLADFIEEGRSYEPSLRTREYVFSNMVEEKYRENIKILHKGCLMEMDSTIENLTRKNMRISGKTLKTRDALKKRI